MVGPLVGAGVVGHHNVMERRRLEAEHLASFAASVEREKQALREAADRLDRVKRALQDTDAAKKTKQQSPSGWLCDREPCNEGDLHLDRPPPGTEHFRDPVPTEPPTKPTIPPGGP